MRWDFYSVPSENYQLNYELYFYSRYRFAWLAETLIWLDGFLWCAVVASLRK